MSCSIRCVCLSRENMMELQRSHMEEMELEKEELREELRRREEEYKEKLLQNTSRLR